MASVKSLGVHQPTGLRHAVQERLLPRNAPASTYSWEVIEDHADDGDGEDELLTTGDCVIWSRGGIFRKSFKFDLEKEPITLALLTYFPNSDDAPYEKHEDAPNGRQTGRTKKDEKSTLSKALVVFLRTQAHICFLSGASHIVHMPFEVESACAAPYGVIIQRKSKSDNSAPVSLRFPRVPPNSFVSSQISPASLRKSTIGSAFSTEGLGRPKTLPLRLSSTLENTFEVSLEASGSHWPRLVCLTDPLLELGLVVTHSDKPSQDARRRGPIPPSFLDPAEEILHIEGIQNSERALRQEGLDDLVLAVTVNRETNMYSVWQLTYMKDEDIILGHKTKSRGKKSRRQSSMQPGMTSGTATPLPPSFRESFGAPLPGKKPRKSERFDKPERTEKGDKVDKAIEKALSLESDKGGEVTRRQSRRVSSLLARADLSTSHDRSAFPEQSTASVTGAERRNVSLGSQRGRSSGVYAHLSTSGAYNQNLNSLLEAPVDDLLEELRTGGDFEGFHDMGLDDHDFDGLARKMLLTKIHSVPMDTANVRYSLSDKPARSQSKVFILTGPPYALDEQGRRYLLVGIQDPVDKRLQLLTLFLEKQRKFDLTVQESKKSTSSDASLTKITPGVLRRAQNVVDSCKISDGDQSMILILSESMAGDRELSIQAPWSAMSTITLPKLYFDNLNSLDYRGRHVNREVRGRRYAAFSSTNIIALCHSRPKGVVDIRDQDGRVHRIQIQLQPRSSQVRQVLEICRSVLPTSYGEKMMAGWWHLMKWLPDLGEDIADLEWSCFVVLLFALFLALDHTDPSTMKYDAHRPRPRKSRSSEVTAVNWEEMQTFDTPNTSACPSWMRSHAWRWLMDDDSANPTSSVDYPGKETFLARHIRYAKQYLASPIGQTAIGPAGYLPTALNRSSEGRRKAAWAIIIALHLLVEEQKLNVMSPEYLSPGRADLRVVLCQIGRWLRWPSFVALHEIGIQATVEPKHDSELVLDPPLSDPPSTLSVFQWIQSHLTGDRSVIFPTLSDVYDTVNRETVGTPSKHQKWDIVTPRTIMFEKLFAALKPSGSHVEFVEAMHSCGFTTVILETLPEAVLAPLQDAISMCQPMPPSTWDKEMLALINRSDMNLMLKPGRHPRASSANIIAPSHIASRDFHMICQGIEEYNNTGYDEGNGTERQAVVRALFKEDRRLNEAQNLLSTHRPRVIRLNAEAHWSEPEYLEKQKELVTTVANGTLAISTGRGLLYYSLRFPLLTQKFSIAGFNLTCLIKPANNTVTVDKLTFTEEKVNWAFFHQGVAGGLAISPKARGIDTSWILYNKPGQDLNNRHAGFLLALGLNGHLKSVAKWVAFKYLTPKHTMTSIGLLLGLAASYMGTMDSLITRLLSVHVTRMLPRGAAELNLSHYTQTTGIMGIGLLYCNSQHRRMSEIMMSEIEYDDDEDEEDPLRNEGYRLAAGFALGFINLGKGTDLRGLHDMRLTEKLLTLASSTKKVELVNVLDRSAPGAVVAIALIFMKSEDHIVARKVDVPDSVLQFSYVRPDILLLRTMAKHLIMWSKIQPTFEWVRASLPRELQWRYKLVGTHKLRSKDTSFFSIMAGICFSIGLRFAGSANTQVRDLLVHYLDQFMRIMRMSADNFDEQLTRGNVCMCMDVVALSAATVMAGTGDLVVMRRLRSLHGRDDPHTTYGSHLAAHLAIGTLFLGCGTATFSTSNMAIGALIVAFYPLFPANVQDNRSHLQAFRHFWVLATDPRCLVVKDVATSQPVTVPVLIKLKRQRAHPTNAGSPSKAKPSSHADVVVLRKNTPCLLPPLENISSVRTDATALGYWDLELDFENKPELIDSFRENQSLYLRRRPIHEGAFAATVRAMGHDALLDATDKVEPGLGVTSAGTRKKDPLEWVFDRDALRGLTHAERAMVLDLLGGEGEGGAGSAVDARLSLEAGLDGWSREDLEGLRLLFDWADKRSLPNGSGSVEETGADAESGWWLRDSIIEMLKGKAWFAAREEET